MAQKRRSNLSHPSARQPCAPIPSRHMAAVTRPHALMTHAVSPALAERCLHPTTVASFPHKRVLIRLHSWALARSAFACNLWRLESREFATARMRLDMDSQAAGSNREAKLPLRNSWVGAGCGPVQRNGLFLAIGSEFQPRLFCLLLQSEGQAHGQCRAQHAMMP